MQELDISYNLLESLPVQLAELEGTLKTLKLDGGSAHRSSDAISSPPKAVWLKDGKVNLDGIFDFLKA